VQLMQLQNSSTHESKAQYEPISDSLGYAALFFIRLRVRTKIWCGSDDGSGQLFSNEQKL
jgi:hypothetical protein